MKAINGRKKIINKIHNSEIINITSVALSSLVFVTLPSLHFVTVT